MEIIGIIPARYASTRFPGKPLANIAGKSMIQRVYEQSLKVFKNVYVATDDERIYKHVEALGFKVVMTSDKHKSGTERCAEAFETIQKNINIKFDIVVNIQGDEPFISPQQLQLLVSAFKEKETQIATLIKKIEKEQELFDSNKTKVIIDNEGKAIYFSRAAIPFIRNFKQSEWLKYHVFYKHIGLYAYYPHILKEITQIPISSLEQAESLEQLRWIENGYHIQTRVTDIETFSIDTPEDLKYVLKMIENQ